MTLGCMPDQHTRILFSRDCVDLTTCSYSTAYQCYPDDVDLQFDRSGIPIIRSVSSIITEPSVTAKENLHKVKPWSVQIQA